MFGSITKISSLLFGFLVVLGNHLTRAEENEDDYLFCNRDVCLPKNYSTDTLPMRPVKVGIQVYSIEVKRVMDEDMSLMVELGISMVWRDSRFVRIESETNTTSRTRVPLSTKLSDYMWKPYLYLENVKDIGNKFNLVKDLPLVFYIPTNQNIGKGGVVPLQLWCSMKFDRFPMDIQKCRYNIWPLHNNFDEVQIKFDPSINPRIKGNNLDYEIAAQFSQGSGEWFWIHGGANVSRIWFELTLTRKPLRYLLESFLPSGCFVILSWLGFLVPPDSVPGRLGLLVTLFLCQTNTLNNLITSGPRGSNGTTALIEWVIMCTGFIIAAMLEYGYILIVVINKVNPEKKDKQAKAKTKATHILDQQVKSENCHFADMGGRRPAFKLDMIMLALFPMVFLISAAAFMSSH